MTPARPNTKSPPLRERRRKSSQRGSLATPLESIICPLELAGESYRRVWGDYLCSSPMFSQLCSASSAPSLNGFRLLTSASFSTSSCVDFQSITHVIRFLPVPATSQSPLAAQTSAFRRFRVAVSVLVHRCPTFWSRWFGGRAVCKSHQDRDKRESIPTYHPLQVCPSILCSAGAICV